MNKSSVTQPPLKIYPLIFNIKFDAKTALT